MTNWTEYDKKYPHHHKLYPMLGLKAGQHLPDEGLPITLANGRCYRVLPKAETPVPNAHKGRPHRVQGMCDGCMQWIPAGRLNQHEPKCVKKWQQALVAAPAQAS
jgi:hypothetical protein